MRTIYNVRTGVVRTKSKVRQYTNRFTVAAAASVAALGIALMPAASAAAGSYSLFGDATIVSNGHPGNAAQISNGAPGYGGVDFTGTGVNTLANLNSLSTDYNFTQGNCELGSPRFGATVTNGTNTGTVFFYIGPAPNYTNCPQNVWTNTGNLAAPANLVDTSQLPGGNFYQPYAAAQTQYGGYTVTDLFVVNDDYANPQTVLLDNTVVGSATYNYDQPTSADSCKNGGWQTMKDGNGNSFKNQGDCVSWVQHNVNGNGTPANGKH